MDIQTPMLWMGAFFLACIVVYTFAQLISFGVTMGHWKAKLKIGDLIKRKEQNTGG